MSPTLRYFISFPGDGVVLGLVVRLRRITKMIGRLRWGGRQHSDRRTQLQPRQPSLPARVHCLTAPPHDAAHMTVAPARGPRSPEERLQPKELGRVARVQVASAGRRAPPALPPRCYSGR
ncbi:hypothetical protein NDU88_000163 [Pleurodeles waltl]|uniref:Uncharacterized protein n=1 Tax=Pleurodeles waltl TaxID=8319 RepID=A0AAV7TGD3_PLEWA|nr:hypothetical protein NDU88_000163 [Pleurodeles waltl]